MSSSRKVSTILARNRVNNGMLMPLSKQRTWRQSSNKGEMIPIQRGGFQTSSLPASDIFNPEFPILHVNIAFVSIVHVRWSCDLLAGTAATLPASNAAVMPLEVQVLSLFLPLKSRVDVESFTCSEARRRGHS